MQYLQLVKRQKTSSEIHKNENCKLLFSTREERNVFAQNTSTILISRRHKYNKNVFHFLVFVEIILFFSVEKRCSFAFSHS